MCQQQWVRIKAWYPENVVNNGADSYTLPLNNLYKYKAEAEFEFNFEEYKDGTAEILLDVALVGRHSSGIIKVTLCQSNK